MAPGPLPNAFREEKALKRSHFFTARPEHMESGGFQQDAKSDRPLNKSLVRARMPAFGRESPNPSALLGKRGQVKGRQVFEDQPANILCHERRPVR